MRPARRGHILPLTLAILAIAGGVMARVCRDGMMRSLAVAREEQELQRDWAVRSCQSTVLPRAGGLLVRAEQAAGRPVLRLERDVFLCGRVYHLTIADEQAKANINLLYARDRNQAERAARTAARAGSGLIVRLRPLTSRVARTGPTDTPPLAFDSMGQVFVETGDAPAVRTAARGLTCWGGGKLNWRRASRDSLGQVLAGHPDLARQVLRQQAAGKDGSFAAALDALQVSAAKRSEFDKLFTEGTNAQSLWIVSQGAASLSVRENLDEGRTRVISHSW
jgi:hypothetical protein